MDDREITETSKALSWLLRHGAGERGLAMDPAGWVAVDEVLRELGISAALLHEVVRRNDKSRLQLEGGRIRACQGHSLSGMPVTCEALEASWEVYEGGEALWHGTTVESVAAIAREGIRAVTRTHVHLAEALDSRVGKRAQVAVMLEVCPARLRAVGQAVYRSPNGVLLVRFVPPGCIVGLRAMTARARAAEPHLRALLVAVAG